MTNKPTSVPTAFARSSFAFIALILFVGLAGLNNSHASTDVPVPRSVQATEQAQRVGKGKAPAHIKRSTPVYGHSVIPGGVREASELTSALARDQVTRAHFANFDAANAYLVHAKEPQQVYVSYRMGNKIYWTKKKVRLAQGEELLTDGKSYIRARCGNRIAEVPQLVVSNREPAPEVLDTVIARSSGARGVNATNNAGLLMASSDGVYTRAAATGAAVASAPQGQAPSFAPQGGRFNAPQMPLSLGAELPLSLGAGLPLSLGAGLAPAALDQVKDLALALITGTNTGVVPVPGFEPVTRPPLTGVELVPPTLTTILLPPTGIVSEEPILTGFPRPPSTILTTPTVPSTDHTPTDVPEPGSFALAILALFLLGLRRPRVRQTPGNKIG